MTRLMQVKIFRWFQFARLVVLSISVGLVGSWAWGAGTTGADFLQTQAPAGMAALGAGVADARGGESLNWNPAGMVAQPYASLAFTHFSGLVDTAYEQVEGYVPDLLGGAWGARVFYDSTYNFTEVDASGEAVGNLENYDLLLHLAHTRTLLPGWTAGLGLKIFESVLAGYHSQGVALDLGMRYAPVQSFWAVGCVLDNIGSKTAFDQETDQLPLSLTAGLACTWHPAQGHEVRVLGDLHVPLAGDETSYPLLGVEYALQDFIFMRGGYRWENELGALSLGAGLRWSRWGMDYAFQPLGTLGNNHRFTLTYTFKPLPAEAPPAITPTPTATPEAAAVPVPTPEPRLKSLTVSPREVENVVSFHVPAMIGAPKAQALVIRDAQNRPVKTFTWIPGLPTEVRWDGRDEQGRLVSSQAQFSYCWAAAGQTGTVNALPQLRPVLKLCFADGTTLEPQADFMFLTRPQGKSWSLMVYRQGAEMPVRTWSGDGALPEMLTWDGQAAGHLWAPTQAHYRYRLALADVSGQEVALQESIHAITARRVEAPAGKIGLLIPEILFDFNSAVLKPEMLDKITAAAQVLKRHPGQATAVCEGHADEIGSAEYNRVISGQRGAMVAAFLSDTLGVSKDTLSVRGFGKEQPADPGTSEEARARNRRVEIRLTLPAPQ
ncbi:MAG: PorV/PorQ family protein [Candidatus Firestonebacteria bacterium]|nr:PorV/PorQ family protein [Candidatus Firestonebacteria bacterium]